jgi:hypothetical protein
MSSLNITGTVAGTVDDFGGYGYGNRDGYGIAAGYGVGGSHYDCLQNQISQLSDTMSANFLSEKFQDVSGQMSSDKADILNTLANLLAQFNNSQIANTAAVNASQIANTAAFNAMQSGLTAAFNQNTLQTLNSFNGVTTSMLQGFNIIGRDADAKYAAINLQATINAAEAARCCCEVKSLILEDGCKTRETVRDQVGEVLETMNDIRIGELQTQLNDTKMALSNSAQTNQIAQMLASINVKHGHHD